MSISYNAILVCFPSIEVIKTIFTVNIDTLVLHEQTLYNIVIKTNLPLIPKLVRPQQIRPSLFKWKRPTKSIIHANVRPHGNVVVRNGVAGCGTN